MSRVNMGGHYHRDWGCRRDLVASPKNFSGGVCLGRSTRTIADGARDNTVRLWNVASGECLMILFSLPEGWVAIKSDGRYRMGGNINGGVWHAVGLCRFELGELDEYIGRSLRLPEGEALW